MSTPDNGNGNGAVRDMQSLLLPLDEHPARELIDFEIDTKDLETEPPPLPWGMVWSPPSCENYLQDAIPDIFTHNGWMRATNRRSKTFRHDHFYFEAVLNVPGGADLNRIRDAALTCASGTLTLESKITGRVTYTEIEAPAALNGAPSLAMRIEVSFDKPENEEQERVLAMYRYGDGKSAVVDRKDIVYTLADELLYVALSPVPNFAAEMATTMHQRFRQLRGTS